MKRIKILIISTIAMTSFMASGQDTLSISKSEVLEKIIENNLQIKVAEKSFESARGRLPTIKCAFLAKYYMLRIQVFLQQIL